MTAAPQAGACADCGAALERGQRYCLECGARTGPRSPQLLELLAQARAGREAGAGATPAPAPPARAAHVRAASRLVAAPAALTARLGAMRLPSRRVCAALLLAFLGFGVVLGDAAASRVAYTAAASRAPLRLVLPAQVTGGAQAPEAEAPAAEVPETSEEPTPEPPEAAEAAEAATSPAASPAPAGGGGAKTKGGSGGSGKSAPAASATKLPAIGHVFVLMLSDEPYAAVFGPESPAPYLARTLERRGALLARYYAVAHEQLANGIALIGGQGPTPATAANCPVYSPLQPATSAAEGQVIGEGCVYPPTTPTLPGQLEVKRLSWRAYLQGAGEAGAAAPACAHPALGEADPGAAPGGTQASATYRNPFVYFEGLTDSPSCTADDVGLGSLRADLASAKRTPALSYIVPDRCHDGSPGPCPGGGPGGLPAAEAMLKEVVPEILASPAYRRDGLLVITVDEAPSSGEFADSSSCCGQPSFPNLPPAPGAAAGLAPAGGGQVGALLLSPYVKAKTTSQEPYNHFSLLRTIEDLFGLKHIGYAAGAKVPPFEPSLFTAKPAG